MTGLPPTIPDNVANGMGIGALGGLILLAIFGPGSIKAGMFCIVIGPLVLYFVEKVFQRKRRAKNNNE